MLATHILLLKYNLIKTGNQQLAPWLVHLQFFFRQTVYKVGLLSLVEDKAIHS